eukprot:CAMPEP_0202879782 /NCGR_PEP_ID=MMETSP1391-20130828/34099_1 /ASSEMBLY_ACC=CAM_ASM_000867 /TAXON_ID=1034604 /ORGANISM="Chlamydomonas leiostraca, Strain SAG 11-49" /LENGTH=307 /DNA_ID=CAMNT_0049562183 /DNA_START=172 /DNA_END=1095 /DNA_ORIENTATION=+
MVRHRQLLAASKSSLVGDHLTQSSLELARMLKKSPGLQRLQTLHTERSPGMSQVTNFFERLRSHTQKRLTTTVEEDASNREYYEEVRAREEKAVAEKTGLEQKLRLQQVELARAAAAVQSAEDKTRAELHEVASSTASTRGAIQGDAVQTRTNDADSYAGEHDNLSKELAAAKAELQRARDEHKEVEAGLRKAKKRAQQDVESVITDYDTDVGSKDGEYQAALAEYNEVLRQLEEYTRGHAQLVAERLAYEEAERIREEERLERLRVQISRSHAARVIQRAWRAYKARKAAELKKKKKAEAAAKKKK